MDIGQRARERRSSLGLSREAVAERAEVAVGTIWNVESGENVKVDTLSKVAKALATSVATLLGEVEPVIDDALPGWNHLTDDERATVTRTVALLASGRGEDPVLRAVAEDGGDYAAVIPPLREGDDLEAWIDKLPDVTERTVRSVLDFQNRRSMMLRDRTAGQPSGGGVDKRAETDADHDDPRRGAR